MLLIHAFDNDGYPIVSLFLNLFWFLIARDAYHLSLPFFCSIRLLLYAFM